MSLLRQQRPNITTAIMTQYDLPTLRDCAPLLHAQRHEPQLAVTIRDQQQHGLLAVLLELVDPLLDVGTAGDGFLRNLDDDVARGEPLLGGVRIGVDIGDDHALDGVLDLVARAQILADRREIEAERLLRHRLLGCGLVGLHRGLDLVGILEAAEHDLLGLLLALADDDDVDLLADRRVGDDAGEILRVLDVLAVELDDDVAGLDAGGLGRALVVDARDQRATRRLDVEALGDLVGDALDAYAEPAAAQFAELAELV